MKKRTCEILLLCLVVFARNSDGQEPKRSGRITISPETTVLTEPLDDQGYVDYLAAMNNRVRQGVTQENNAAVPLRQLLGLRELRPALESEYFKMLGIDPPAEGDPRLVTQSDLLREHPQTAHNVMLGEFNSATSGPWKAKEYPVAAEWIRRNETTLGLVRQAVRRTHFYTPLLSESGRLFDVLLPDTQNSRSFARLLAADAMLNLGNGNHGAALDDLLAMHRLAGHVGNGVTIIDVLVAFAIRSMAFRVEEQYLNAARPNAARRAFWDQKFATVRTVRPIADVFDEAERYMFLDSVCGIERGLDLARLLGGIAMIDDAPAEPADPIARGAHEMVRKKLMAASVDFDQMLRDANAEYDRVRAMLAMKDPVARRKAFAEFEAAMQERREKTTNLGFAALLLSDKQLTPYLRDTLLVMLVPAIKASRTAETMDHARREVAGTAWALSAHYAQHKSFPQNLEQLVPRYLSSVPADPFNGKPLRYAVRGDSCVVYSVGRNLIDDGGQNARQNDIVLELRR